MLHFDLISLSWRINWGNCLSVKVYKMCVLYIKLCDSTYWINCDISEPNYFYSSFTKTDRDLTQNTFYFYNKFFMAHAITKYTYTSSFKLFFIWLSVYVTSTVSKSNKLWQYKHICEHISCQSSHYCTILKSLGNALTIEYSRGMRRDTHKWK